MAVVVGGGSAWDLRQQHLEQVAAEEKRRAEQAQQEVEREREVNRDLADVMALQLTDDWEKGWPALKRAEGRLVGSTDEELRQRVEKVRRDQDLLAKLDEARLQGASPGRTGLIARERIDSTGRRSSIMAWTRIGLLLKRRGGGWSTVAWLNPSLLASITGRQV